MTPFSRTRTLVSALVLLSVAGCGAGMPGTAAKHSIGNSSADSADPTEARRSGAGLSSALSRVGHTAASNGNYPTAIRMYRRAHNLAPNQIGPALGLARASAAVKDHRAASEAFRAVLRVEPHNIDALSGLGRELMSLDRPSEAIPYLSAALGQRREAWVHNELGVAYEMTGAVGSAMEQYQAGLELAARDLSLRTNLGRTLAWTGDYEAAIEVLRAVAADSDATRRHRETLALVFALGGDIPSAQTVSRIDMPAKDVSGKLAYFGLLSELARSEDRDAVAKVLAGSALRTVSASPRAGGAAPMADRRELRQSRADLEKMARAREAAAKAALRMASSAETATKSTDAAATPRKLTPAVPQRVTRKAATRTQRPTRRARVIPAKAVVTTAGGPYAWQVQLAAFRTPARTEIGWNILHRIVPEVLAPLDHFVRNPNPKWKWDRLFRLRTYAFAERGPADEVCARIKARDLECLVVRTQRVPGLRMVSHSRVAHANPEVDLESPTPIGATAYVPSDDSSTVVSRRTGTPAHRTAAHRTAAHRTAKGPTTAGEVMKTAIERQRSVKSRMAKKRARHAAYQVQLAAYRTANRAERGWREIRRAAPDLLGNLGHMVKKTKTRTAGTGLHRLRTLAYADRAPAQALCEKLKRRDIECLVVSTLDHAGLVYEPSEFEKADTPPPQPSAAAMKDGNQRFAEARWPKDFDAF